MKVEARDSLEMIASLYEKDNLTSQKRVTFITAVVTAYLTYFCVFRETIACANILKNLIQFLNNFMLTALFRVEVLPVQKSLKAIHFPCVIKYKLIFAIRQDNIYIQNNGSYVFRLKPFSHHQA